jgi:DNA-binding transcriptional MerR regulator
MQGQALDLAPWYKVYGDAVRIAELAAQVGVPTSTVRYYERVGLLDSPARTQSGYRDYDDDAAARLLFISRARRMGLSCDQVSELLPVWAGTNCGAAHERVRELIADKKADIAARIAELENFAAQLDLVRAALDASPPPNACRTDLSCCVPDAGAEPVPVDLLPMHPANSR